MVLLQALLLLTVCGADQLGPGNHTCKLTVDERQRSYLVHVPQNYDQDRPTPVVLVFHGAGTNADITVRLTGLNQKSDEAGFIAVYPNGTGTGIFRTWNAGGRKGKLAENSADDVKFVSNVLDDLSTIVNIDTSQVYATGISNGGMMCYRLAAELSHRIAAIAPVAGAMAIDDANPIRPVSVMHFHGKVDSIVPFDGPNKSTPKFLTFKSVEDTIEIWRKIDECPEQPTITDFPDTKDDGTTVQQKAYGPGKENTEVILIEIEGGGHTWPGHKSYVSLTGKSTKDISANDLMWDFFQKHPRK